MALMPCRECGQNVSTEAVACPHCGAPKPSSKTPPPKEGPHWGVIGIFAFVAILLAGNYRVVTGVPGVRIVQRQTFGFDEPLASVEDCTSVPWIVALAANGRLCRDLQAVGILQSDEARRMEIEMEIERRLRLRDLGINRR